jgi:anti-sigma-K factor RskA
MSPAMTHDEVRAALAAEALGALDGPEAAEVRAHLETCEACRRELAAYRDAAASLAYAAPPAPLDAERSSRLRARLVARAAADRGDGATSAPAAPAPVTAETPGVIPITRAPSRRFSGGWLAAAAAVVLLIGVGAWATRLNGRYGDLRERYATLRGERDRLAGAIAGRDSTLASLSGPDVQVIDLASTQRQAPSGRMFWDRATARWTFFAHDLPALRAKRDYQLWLLTPAGPVSAGVFKPTQDGAAVVQATYPLPRDQLTGVAVTEEPEGGLPAPSGTPLILGQTAQSE